MTTSAKQLEKRVLIVEHDGALRERMEALLTQRGYRVRQVNSSYGALAVLEETEIPFAVIISSYRMPRMGGDELLRNAKEVAPDTQRMLLINSIETETAVNAVNRAGIHSCIMIPFQEEVFLAEVALRIDHFDRIRKKARLMKVTSHQNQQLYKVAVSLKEKKEAFDRRIQEKRRTLEALKKSENTSLESDSLTSRLEILLMLRGISPSQEAFQKEFKRLSQRLKRYLETVFFDNAFELDLSRKKKAAKDKQDPEKAKEKGSAKIHALPKDRIASLLETFLDYEASRGETPKGAQAHVYPAKPKGTAVLKPISSDGDKAVGKKSDERNAGETLEERDAILVEISKDNLSAFIYLKKQSSEPETQITPDHVKARLESEGIVFGIVADADIEAWLESNPTTETPLAVAVGTPALQPVDAGVTFHFDVDFLHVGEIDEDGTIDFKERGDTPFVKAETLLAEKTAPVDGKPGMDIYGHESPVKAPEDVLFNAGKNTRFSEDKLKIYAVSEGQPHLDAMGTVSVYPELRINGDVDYGTGNIHFNGNLVVSGVIREGFSVRCANLTVEQVHGAEVNITGDLNVSTGIIDSTVINVQGNIQAKYINNSRIKVFRDLIVQREIIDSKLFVGGVCINENGAILSSFVNAKGGIRAGTVGREKAAAAKLEVGTEGLIEMIVAELDERMEKSLSKVREMQDEIRELEAEENILHEKISDAAYVQDRSQIELRDIQRKLPDMKKAEDLQSVHDTLEMVTLLQDRASDAEAIINDAFERQNEILELVHRHGRQINTHEETAKEIEQKKTAIRAYGRKMPARPELQVHKDIVAGTLVSGRKSRIVLKDDLGACRIHEVRKARTDTGPLYEMRLSRL